MQIESFTPIPHSTYPTLMVTYGLDLFPVDLIKEILSYLTPAETLRSTTLVGRCLNPIDLGLLEKTYWQSKCARVFPQSVECVNDVGTIDWQKFYRDSTILHRSFVEGHISQTTKFDHPDFNVKWVKQSGDLVLVASEQRVSIWCFAAPQKKLLGEIEVSESKIEAIAFHAGKIHAGMTNLEIWIWDVKNLAEKSIITIPRQAEAKNEGDADREEDSEAIVSIEVNGCLLACLFSTQRLVLFDSSRSTEPLFSTEHIDTLVGFLGNDILCYTQTENNEHKLLKINSESLEIDATYLLDYRYKHKPSSIAISGKALFILTTAKIYTQNEGLQPGQLGDNKENPVDIGASYEAVLEAWDLTGNRKVFTYKDAYNSEPTSLVAFQGAVFLLSNQTILKSLKTETGHPLDWKGSQQLSWPEAKEKDLKGGYDWKLINGVVVFANSILDLQTGRSVLTGKIKCPHNYYHAESTMTSWLNGRLVRIFKCGAIYIQSFLKEEAKPKLKKMKLSPSDCSIGSKKSLDRSRENLSAENLSADYSTDYSMELSDSDSEFEKLSDITEENDLFT